MQEFLSVKHKSLKQNSDDDNNNQIDDNLDGDLFSGIKKKRKLLESTEHEVDEDSHEPPVDKSTVIDRLRMKGQVATFFGESDWMR